MKRSKRSKGIHFLCKEHIFIFDQEGDYKNEVYTYDETAK